MVISFFHTQTFLIAVLLVVMLSISIAAASILAKTHRDEYMMNLHGEYPDYQWDKNKGYPTIHHGKP